MERQQKIVLPRMSVWVESSSPAVVHERVARFIEEGGGIVQPTWTVCLDEIVSFFAGG